MTKRSRKVLFSLLLLSCFLMTACQPKQNVEKEKKQEKKVQEELSTKPGDEALVKDMKVNTIIGDETYLYNILSRAELTVVNIWSPSCVPCEEALPILGSLDQEYAGNGVQVVGIISGISDPWDKETLAMIDQAGVDYTQILDSGEVTTQFLDEASQVPVTLFIDWKGNILGQIQSGDMTAAQWKEEIDKYHTDICIDNHPSERGVT